MMMMMMMMMCNASAVNCMGRRLALKLYMCTDEVKITLFRAYFTSLYTSHLWCKYSKAKMRKLQVAFNKHLGLEFCLSTQDGQVQVNCRLYVPMLNAVLRKCMYNFVDVDWVFQLTVLLGSLMTLHWVIQGIFLVFGSIEKKDCMSFKFVWCLYVVC